MARPGRLLHGPRIPVGFRHGHVDVVRSWRDPLLCRCGDPSPWNLSRVSESWGPWGQTKKGNPVPGPCLLLAGYAPVPSHPKIPQEDNTGTQPNTSALSRSLQKGPSHTYMKANFRLAAPEGSSHKHKDIPTQDLRGPNASPYRGSAGDPSLPTQDLLPPPPQHQPSPPPEPEPPPEGMPSSQGQRSAQVTENCS